MTSSCGNIFRVPGPSRGNPQGTGDSPNKDQWRRGLMFYLICAWTTVWANTRDAGDLRRHRAHNDVILINFRNFTHNLHFCKFNLLWPNDALWRHKSRSTLAQVMAWCQATTWTSAELSSVSSSGIQLSVIWPAIIHPSSTTKINLKITCLKFYSNLPGANEWIYAEFQVICISLS